MIDDAFREELSDGPLAGLDDLAREIFFDRVAIHFPDLLRPLEMLYGGRWVVADLVRDFVRIAARRYAERPRELRRLDLRRLTEPDWFQRPEMVGYACYADRFAGSLGGVAERIPYLQGLGVTYLHLMPLLEAREGENDGGYAVADYGSVDPRLGTMADLAGLGAALRKAGISLCIDVVCNHTANTHEWARRALAGEERYQEYYLMYADRSVPDRHEQTLREIFPDSAPGNFTWQPGIARWVWTTFHEYQWDLNYGNPVVLAEMADILLDLANHGAEVLRLDAVAFMWKRLGTTSENLPEAHAILQFWRALTRIAAPGVLLLAEAIVPIEDTMPYFGQGEATGKECELGYHHFFMVLLWSSLAEQSVRLMTAALDRAGSISPGAAWCTYVRSHDDIGWAITPEDAATVGLDDHAHRRFLSDFYAGDFPGSFARGEVFQHNPKTEDRRICGTTASLAGLESALDSGDDVAAEMAFRRIRLLYSMVAAHGGIPIIWSGDEVAALNDASHLDDPAATDDNRWLHRPRFDWGRLGDIEDPATAAGRAYRDLMDVLEARKAAPELHAAASTAAVDTGNDAVLGLRRRSARGLLVAVGNFTPTPQAVPGWRLAELGLGSGLVDVLNGGSFRGDEGLTLDAYEARWLAPAG